ncbi:MAG: hypothetical protein L3K14_08050 [Thermoplasmata archaeon]|nr:hypothetical protein [Thermoplasmata archaeon]
MSGQKTDAIPLAALGVPAKAEYEPDIPLAYVPRVPIGPSYREMIERAVGWSRR